MTYFGKIAIKFNWILAMTHFGTTLDYFQKDAIEFRQRHILELSQNNLEQMQLIFGWDKTRECFRTISIKCKWFLSRTQFGIFLVYFREDAIECQLTHNFDISWKNSGQIQLNFVYDTFWKCLRLFSKRCNWNLTKTQFGIVSEQFRSDAIDFWLGRNSRMF